MLSSITRRFTDPYEHQTSIYPAIGQLFITAPGDYRGELTRVELHGLWLQRTRNSLPHVGHWAASKDRVTIFLLSEPAQAPMHRSGVEFSSGDMGFNSLGGEQYHRFTGEARWATLSLLPADLAAAGKAIIGRELAAPSAGQVIRPAAHLMSRVRSLHEAAGRLAATVPDILAHPEVARALEQELVRVTVQCIAEGTIPESHQRYSTRVPVMQRFDRFLEENPDNPLYIAEICAAIGVADRTLRIHCLEHLGMGPHQYLWLRRMHLARRALSVGNPTAHSVTAIANDYGFGELGRFAVAYRRLFGESPSATLRQDYGGGAALTSRFPILP